MPIINTIRKPGTKSSNQKLKNLTLSLAIFILGCSGVGLLSSCAQKDNLAKAKNYAQQSEFYYWQSVNIYQELIKKGENLNELHLALGRLFYQHGEFKKAAGEIKKTVRPEGKRLLAMTYYRLGNFTDALEIFSKNEKMDDEQRYYYGMTCEKLNLFDQALEIYQKIKNKEFLPLAQKRITHIEKGLTTAKIQELSPEVAEILGRPLQQEEYPQAGALVLFCREKVILTPGDTQVSYLHYLVKILNERGKENFSEVQIDYDSTYEKIELEFARTIRPDGAVVEVGSRHIRDVSKYLNFPLYSNARVYIISFPEISEGAAVEYKLKIYRNKLINDKDFVISYPVQASEPIISATFSVEIPRGRTLEIKTLNKEYNNFGADLNPTIEEKQNSLIYYWQFKNIPQIIPESNMPPQVQINPAILISTFKNWQEVYNWWWLLAKDKVKADASIRNKVQEITRGLNSQEEKARAIYNFCAQKIRYVAVEYGQAGYEPHRAEDIFQNKYGDCKDQAILLVTMLKEAGINSWPVLIGTKEAYDLEENFPAVLFNHCIASLALKDRIFFLDPTAETCAFFNLPDADQERKVLIVKETNYEIAQTPRYPAEHNYIKQFSKINIDKSEKIKVEKKVFTQGLYDQAQRYWLLYTPPELIRAELEENIQEVSIGARLRDYNIENLKDLNQPIVLSYNFEGPEYFTSAGKLRIMPQLASLDTASVAKDKRRYPIDFGILDTQEAIYEIEIPENFFITYMPPDINQDSPWFSFFLEYKKKNSGISFHQKIILKETNIPQGEYRDFKIYSEKLAKQVKQRIVLERTR